MPLRFDTLSALLNHGFDTVIDVRSPAEFAEDHIPGAINLPAMSNDERAQIGTIYTQDSPFKARKLGAAIVSRNVANHLEGPLAGKSGDWRPLVYCWRGGQRSGSVAIILQQIGWRAETVEGGYQSYRRLIHDAMYNQTSRYRFILLDGYTGTAKTEILHHLAERGVQTLDLEGAANHRGSMLGGYAGNQPSQKAFESRLAGQLAGFDPDIPVLVEAESSKIGKLNIPPAIWKPMLSSPAITLRAPLSARVAYLVKTYQDVVSDRDELLARLQPLRQFRGHDLVDQWTHWLQQGDLAAFASSIVTNHYDPAYSKSQIKSVVTETIEMTSLSQADLLRTADRVEQAITSIAERQFRL